MYVFTAIIALLPIYIWEGVVDSPKQPNQLSKIINEHREWLNTDGKSGKKAYLSNLMLQRLELKKIDLSEADIETAALELSKLNSVDFTKANMQSSQLCYSSLDKVSFNYANLRFSNFSNSDIRFSTFHHTNLKNSTFIGSFIEGVDFENAKLILADFRLINPQKKYGSDLKKFKKNIFRRVNLINTNFENAYLTNADFESAEIHGCSFKYSDFSDTRFVGANFSLSNLYLTNLSKSDLRKAYFKNCNLRGVFLENADLMHANLVDTDLSSANLSGANLVNTRFNDTNLTNTNFAFVTIDEEAFLRLPKFVIDNYKNTMNIVQHSYDEKSNQYIARSIEFPPEYKQAGMSILSYFSEILNKKYPNERVTVRIEQEDLNIKMIIETEDGQKEKIEKELEQYGLVIAGVLSADQYCDKPLEAMALKQKLEMAAMEVKHTKELMYSERKQYENRIGSLEEFVNSFIKKTDMAATTTNIYSNASSVASSNVTDESVRNINIINKTEFSKDDKTLLFELIETIKNNLNEFKVDYEKEQKLTELLGSVKDKLKKEKPDFYGVKDNINSINNLLQGATGSLIASGLLPQIQSIFSSIFG